MPAARSSRDHLLVAAEAFGVLVHDQHDDRRDDIGGVELAEVLQRRHQARDADGKAGRRHRLAAEARDQPVITPAAADRAEAHDLAVLVGDFGQQFGLEDRAGVVFEAADDGGVDRDAVGHRSLPHARARNLLQFVKPATTASIKSH